MQTSQCLNCSFDFKAGEKFCTNCGQKTETHRLNVTHIGHDILHAVTHADKGILHLIKELAFNPGLVAKEYVQGKRKKYFNPFSFLFLVVGIASIFLSMSGFVDFGANAKVPANPISNFLNKHINLIILLNVPFLSFFSWLLFKKNKNNYAEHLVLAAFVSGERSVFFSVLIAPIWMLLHNYYTLLLSVYIFCWLIYFGWTCSQFFTGKKWINFSKGVLVGVLTQLITMVLITAFFYIYFAFFYKR